MVHVEIQSLLLPSHTPSATCPVVKVNQSHLPQSLTALCHVLLVLINLIRSHCHYLLLSHCLAMCQQMIHLLSWTTSNTDYWCHVVILWKRERDREIAQAVLTPHSLSSTARKPTFEWLCLCSLLSIPNDYLSRITSLFWKLTLSLLWNHFCLVVENSLKMTNKFIISVCTKGSGHSHRVFVLRAASTGECREATNQQPQWKIKNSKATGSPRKLIIHVFFPNTVCRSEASSSSHEVISPSALTISVSD